MVKVAPVSGDLLVKLALGALVIGAGVWAVRRASQAVPEAAGRAWDAITQGAYSLAPTNPNNVVYGGVNAGLSRVLGRDETLGGWVYELVNPPAPAPDPLQGTYDGRAAQPWDVTPSYSGGRANNPSAYSADTGAAFGFYRRP